MKERFKKFRIPLTSRHSIDPDEIFFDGSKLKEFEESEISTGKLERPISSFVFYIVQIVQVSVLVLLFGYSAFLIVDKGGEYISQAADNSSRAFPVFADRGLIYSSDGVLLAQNEIYFDVFIKAAKINETIGGSKEDLDYISGNIANALGVNSEDIYKKFKHASEQRFSFAARTA